MPITIAELERAFLVDNERGHESPALKEAGLVLYYARRDPWISAPEVLRLLNNAPNALDVVLVHVLEYRHRHDVRAFVEQQKVSDFHDYQIVTYTMMQAWCVMTAMAGFVRAMHPEPVRWPSC